MAKQKISATVSPERVRRAQELTGSTNLSELLDLGLAALIDRELERSWLAGYADHPRGDLPEDVAVDLGDTPWDPAQ